MANYTRYATHVMSQAAFEAAFKVQISELDTITGRVTC